MSSIADYDWLVHGRWKTLHAPSPEVSEFFDNDENWGSYTSGMPLCGKEKDWAIPGLITRLSAKRCRKCCDLAGFPQGTGSPKNDIAIRKLLGLAVTE